MTSAIHVSVVMPSRNVSATLEARIREGQASLDASGLQSEIIVADMGSADGSQRVALEQGARVIAVPTPALGEAVRAGIETAAGAYIVIGAPGDGCNFADVSRFVRELESGFEVVIGARQELRAIVRALLRVLNRLFFGAGFGDPGSAMIALRSEATRCFELRGLGPEFAGEIAARAAVAKLRVSEIPIGIRANAQRRGLVPLVKNAVQQQLHLLLLYGPRWLFLYPGLILIAAGALMPVVAPALDVFVFATGSILVGLHACVFSVSAKVVESPRGAIESGGRAPRIVRQLNLKRGLSTGVFLIAAGGFVLALGTAMDVETRLSFWAMLAAVVAVLVGIETIFSSLFVCLLGLRSRSGLAAPDHAAEELAV